MVSFIILFCCKCTNYFYYIQKFKTPDGFLKDYMLYLSGFYHEDDAFGHAVDAVGVVGFLQ